MAESSRWPVICDTLPASIATSSPESTPPRLMAGSEKPASRKPSATPGRMAWAMASPIRLMPRSIRNTPMGGAASERARPATAARRMKP